MKVPLKTKLMLMSAIPLLCAIGFGIKLSFDRKAELGEFVSFEEAMQLAVQLAEASSVCSSEQELVWAFGETAVADNGIEVVEKEKTRYREFAQQLDDAIAKIENYKEGMDLSNYGTELKSALEEAFAFHQSLSAHRQNVEAGGMGYGLASAPYNEFKSKMQAVFPALLAETNDKELSLKLTSYSLFLDYHYECTRYLGLMIWGHQVDEYPIDAYLLYEAHYDKSRVLLKHLRLTADDHIVAGLDEILTSEKSQWVESKVSSFLARNNENQLYQFIKDKNLENEFKSRGDSRNAELGEYQAVMRQDVLDYTANKIEDLKANLWMTMGLTALVFFASVAMTYRFGHSISSTIVRITEGIAKDAKSVFSASRQISNASETLANNACLQASSSEETNAMIEVIVNNSNKTAEVAKQASGLIQATSEVIDESDASLADLDSSMGQISNNSEETKKIMSSINEIAFQTNILALNAAVEAARAGEAGAGFAIVAEEVRNLAHRSSSASDSTGKLIESSNSSIQSGMNCTSKTSDAFRRVRESANQVFEMISNIETDTQKQLESILEIGRAAKDVDNSTQSNAAGAEECAASASQLEEFAQTLEQHVERLEVLVYGGQEKRKVLRRTPQSKSSGTSDDWNVNRSTESPRETANWT